jgi:hypothetical protein
MCCPLGAVHAAARAASAVEFPAAFGSMTELEVLSIGGDCLDLDPAESGFSTAPAAVYAALPAFNKLSDRVFEADGGRLLPCGAVRHMVSKDRVLPHLTLLLLEGKSLMAASPEIKHARGCVSTLPDSCIASVSCAAVLAQLQHTQARGSHTSFAAATKCATLGQFVDKVD